MVMVISVAMVVAMMFVLAGHNEYNYHSSIRYQQNFIQNFCFLCLVNLFEIYDSCQRSVSHCQ